MKWTILLVFLMLDTLCYAYPPLRQREFNQISVLSNELAQSCPKSNCAVISLGRSPTPFAAYLEMAEVAQVVQVPLSNFRYGINSNPELSEPHLSKLYSYFDKLGLEKVSKKVRNIVIADYTSTGASLLAFDKYFKQYLREKGIHLNIELACLGGTVESCRSAPEVGSSPLRSYPVQELGIHDNEFADLSTSLLQQRYDDVAPYGSFDIEGADTFPVKNDVNWEKFKSLMKFSVKLEQLVRKAGGSRSLNSQIKKHFEKALQSKDPDLRKYAVSEFESLPGVSSQDLSALLKPDQRNEGMSEYYKIKLDHLPLRETARVVFGRTVPAQAVANPQQARELLRGNLTSSNAEIREYASNYLLDFYHAPDKEELYELARSKEDPTQLPFTFKLMERARREGNAEKMRGLALHIMSHLGSLNPTRIDLISLIAYTPLLGTIGSGVRNNLYKLYNHLDRDLLEVAIRAMEENREFWSDQIEEISKRLSQAKESSCSESVLPTGSVNVLKRFCRDLKKRINQ